MIDPPRTQNADVPAAHRKDPRFRARPFNGSHHPLEAQLAQRLADAGANYQTLSDTINRLDTRNVPPQLTQTRYMAQFTPGAVKPQLLIPANKRRLSWSIGGQDPALNPPGSINLFYSYGFPGTVFALPVVGIAGESNGSVSLDDIWISFNAAIAGAPLTIIGYEGTLALAGHHVFHGRRT